MLGVEMKKGIWVAIFGQATVDFARKNFNKDGMDRFDQWEASNKTILIFVGSSCAVAAFGWMLMADWTSCKSISDDVVEASRYKPFNVFSISDVKQVDDTPVALKCNALAKTSVGERYIEYTYYKDGGEIVAGVAGLSNW